MGVTRGRIVLTANAQYPYKVVLEHDGRESEHPVSTVREGEALIRSRIPSPATAPSRREGSFLLPTAREDERGAQASALVARNLT